MVTKLVRHSRNSKNKNQKQSTKRTFLKSNIELAGNKKYIKIEKGGWYGEQGYGFDQNANDNEVISRRRSKSRSGGAPGQPPSQSNRPQNSSSGIDSRQTNTRYENQQRRAVEQNEKENDEYYIVAKQILLESPEIGEDLSNLDPNGEMSDPDKVARKVWNMVPVGYRLKLSLKPLILAILMIGVVGVDGKILGRFRFKTPALDAWLKSSRTPVDRTDQVWNFWEQRWKPDPMAIYGPPTLRNPEPVQAKDSGSTPDL